MKDHIEKCLKLTLELNLEEIQWLKEVVQNPHVPPGDETSENRCHRQNLWDILSDALK